MNNRGWECPKCGKGLAPWMPSCDCWSRVNIDLEPYTAGHGGYDENFDADAELDKKTDMGEADE